MTLSEVMSSNCNKIRGRGGHKDEVACCDSGLKPLCVFFFSLCAVFTRLSLRNQERLDSTATTKSPSLHTWNCKSNKTFVVLLLVFGRPMGHSCTCTGLNYRTVVCRPLLWVRWMAKEGAKNQQKRP